MFIKRISLLFIVCFFSISTTARNIIKVESVKGNSIIFKGNIQNLKKNFIKIYGEDDNFFQMILVNSQGSFHEELDVKLEGSYNLIIDELRIPIYLVFSDPLTLKANADQFYETAMYYGNNEMRNNYMLKRFFWKKKFLKN